MGQLYALCGSMGIYYHQEVQNIKRKNMAINLRALLEKVLI